MGCEVQKTDTGVEVDVHRFDTKEAAEHYLTVGRRYTYDRHETWGLTSGIDFYQGPNPGLRASLREKFERGPISATPWHGWSVAFWYDRTRHVIEETRGLLRVNQTELGANAALTYLDRVAKECPNGCPVTNDGLICCHAKPNAKWGTQYPENCPKRSK
jgi:hypothetical protein